MALTDKLTLGNVKAGVRTAGHIAHNILRQPRVQLGLGLVLASISAKLLYSTLTSDYSHLSTPHQDIGDVTDWGAISSPHYNSAGDAFSFNVAPNGTGSGGHEVIVRASDVGTQNLHELSDTIREGDVVVASGNHWTERPGEVGTEILYAKEVTKLADAQNAAAYFAGHIKNAIGLTVGIFGMLFSPILMSPAVEKRWRDRKAK